MLRCNVQLMIGVLVAFCVCLRADAGLQFDGRSGLVRIPTLRVQGRTPMTYEFIVTPQKPVDQYGRILSNLSTTDGKRNGLFVGLWRGFWVAGAATNRGVRTLLSEHPVVYGARIHLAAVYEEDEIRLYLNGQPCQSELKLLQPMRTSNEDFLIGAQRTRKFEETFGYRFTGELDAVRISTTARYTRKFDPPDNLEADDRTLLLYQFHKKIDREVRDQSGYSIDGQVTGVRWSPSDPDKPYDEIEQLQLIVGDYQVDRKLSGNASQLSSIFRLTSDHHVLEDEKKIGEWKTEKKNRITISLADKTIEPVTLARNRAGALVGNQKKDRQKIAWSMQRITIAMLWHQYQYDGDRLLKHFHAVLYSNGRIGQIDARASWRLNRNTLLYDWANKNKAHLTIKRDGQYYEGKNLDGHRVVGIRMD